MCSSDLGRAGVCERCWSTPYVHAAGGRTQVVANGWPFVAGYDFDTGAELWRLKTGGDNPIPTPFSAHGLIYVSNGHGGPGHIVSLEEASAIVSRRHGITMASLSGYLAWEFLSGRYLPKIEAALGRSLTTEERKAFSEDAHG